MFPLYVSSMSQNTVILIVLCHARFSMSVDKEISRHMKELGLDLSSNSRLTPLALGRFSALKRLQGRGMLGLTALK